VERLPLAAIAAASLLVPRCGNAAFPASRCRESNLLFATPSKWHANPFHSLPAQQYPRISSSCKFFLLVAGFCFRSQVVVAEDGNQYNLTHKTAGMTLVSPGSFSVDGRGQFAAWRTAQRSTELCSVHMSDEEAAAAHAAESMDKATESKRFDELLEDDPDRVGGMLLTDEDRSGRRHSSRKSEARGRAGSAD